MAIPAPRLGRRAAVYRRHLEFDFDVILRWPLAADRFQTDMHDMRVVTLVADTHCNRSIRFECDRLRGIDVGARAHEVTRGQCHQRRRLLVLTMA